MREVLGREGVTPAVAEWASLRAPEWLRFHIRTNDAPFAMHLARRRQSGPGRARDRETKRH
jgi:hypothetical protein